MNQFKSFKYRFYNFNIAEKLIVINVVLFVLPFFFRTLFFLFNLPSDSILNWFELSPKIELTLFRPWTLFTYAFIHGSLSHILWNMLLLYYSSQFFLNLFSADRFINVYFLGVLAGGLVFLVSYWLFPVFKGVYPSLVGSSAGVMAILIFICTYTPMQEIRLLFFNIKLMYFGIAMVVIDILQIPTSNAGGHIAHLGGALIGYIYASQLIKGNDIGFKFEKVWKSVFNFFKPKSEMKTVYKARKKSSAKNNQTEQQKIDSILDKISASGYESLTKEEKDILFKAGKK